MTPINVFVIDHARTIAYSFFASFILVFAVGIVAKWDADALSIALLSYFVLGSVAIVVLEELAHKNKLRNPFAKAS